MITTIPDRDGLFAFLDWLNWQGIAPNCGVLPAGKHDEPVLLYGIDEGDTMGVGFFRDPGEDADWCDEGDHAIHRPEPLPELPEGPYTVLYNGPEYTEADRG